jgi:hypothetical protein
LQAVLCKRGGKKWCIRAPLTGFQNACSFCQDKNLLHAFVIPTANEEKASIKRFLTLMPASIFIKRRPYLTWRALINQLSAKKLFILSFSPNRV